MLAGSGISVFKPISNGGEKVDTGLPTGKKFNGSMYSYLFPSDLLYKDIAFSLRKQWKNVVFENLLESCPDEVKLRRIIKETFEEMEPNLIHQYIADLPQMSSKKEHFFCYRFQVITSKSETIISILTPKNRSEKSSAESQSRKM